MGYKFDIENFNSALKEFIKGVQNICSKGS